MIDFLELVIEQKKAKKQLQKILDSRRVPHAFIFSGQQGVGKFNTAIQFTKNIYQTFSKEENSKNLNRIDELQEPLIKLIMPLPRGKGEQLDDSGFDKLSKDTLEEIKSELQKKSKNAFYQISIEGANTIKISSIRDIKKFVSFAEDDNIMRFIIIIDSELMNDQAQNALLKNLEEPPNGVFFILLTSQKEKLLPTIVSRCREISFEPLSYKAVSQILRDQFGTDNITANKVARFSSGSVTQANMLIGYDFQAIQQKTISVLRFSFGNKYQAALNELIDFSKNNPIGSVKLLLRMIKIWLNDVIRYRESFDDFCFVDDKETIEKFNSKHSKVKLDFLFANLDYLESLINRNINLNVLFLNLIFELSSVVKRN
ncbi:MAG: DNA polymerase III delta prime subunit [Ignavibacteria bacterium]|nr:MAG: DNA polymerase III delta prime subunit [Ignavibacteria bacterium]KAF0162086.1 MAG: DNA polymerase III delta prime subunit [Ignavibacteria bacterium]